MSTPVASEWTGAAVPGNLKAVQRSVEECLEAAGCPMKTQIKIAVAVEEIFVNIASYAYAPETGTATVRTELSEDPAAVTIRFADYGVPYDPLAREDPDIHLPPGERGVGGLGVLMAKSLMDELRYEYRDGQNILTMKKNL